MDNSLLVNNLRKVISLVDNLRDLGLEELIKLPKVVVVGSQSSGKSSLLQQIVGIDFLPRGSGVVTRRPLQLRMTYDPTLKKPVGKFQQIPGATFTNFNEVREKIEELTDKLCGKEKVIINKPIILNISSASCPNITIVDLPGITSIPIGKQPVNIYDITKEMVLGYIKDERSIILCVIPANQDLAVCESLKITQEIDPRGNRSLGCLTKVDIMDKGTNARQILLNQEIPLRYGYVAIKNRSQQDIIDNVPVVKSLEEEKRYFSTSPVYSTLPPGCTGTQALTDKITKILYTQIKDSMPNIIVEISSKANDIQDKLNKLGPGVAKTPQELIDYVWKQIAKFLRIFKNSLEGTRDPEYGEEPFGPKIRKLLNEFYKDHYDDPATEDLKDEDIEKAMRDFPGDSIPGFPSIDAFLALLNPFLSKLKNPATLLIDEVHKILEESSHQIMEKVMTKKYPVFNSKFLDTVLKVLEQFKQKAKTAVQQLLDAELDYLYTNDMTYLVGNFKIDAKKLEKSKKPLQPLVFELRKRIDAYHHLVVRNLRDLIPKQVSYFQLVQGSKELQFESYNIIGNYEKLEKWFMEPKDIREERERYEKALETLQAAEKRIKRDPEFGRMVASKTNTDKVYSKIGIEPPKKESTPPKYIYTGRKIPSDVPSSNPSAAGGKTPAQHESAKGAGTAPPTDITKALFGKDPIQKNPATNPPPTVPVAAMNTPPPVRPNGQIPPPITPTPVNPPATGTGAGINFDLLGPPKGNPLGPPKTVTPPTTVTSTPATTPVATTKNPLNPEPEKRTNLTNLFGFGPAKK